MIYPQQKGRSGTNTPAPSGAGSTASRSGRSSPVNAAQSQPSQQLEQNTRSHTPTTYKAPQNNDSTPQQQQQVYQPVQSNTSARRPSMPAEAFDSTLAQAPQQAPGIAVSTASDTTNAPNRSRPPSRAAIDHDESDEAGTTAEKLQHMASQKRLSEAATRGGNQPSSSGAAPSPHYPYASNSPRQAKPYEPPADGSSLRHSTSAFVLPPALPASPQKSEDPLQAALAKLKNPSSAVDVLPSRSPGVQGNTDVGMGRMTGPPEQQQQPMSHSPYMQPQQSQVDGRRSPSRPVSAQKSFHSSGPNGGVSAPRGQPTTESTYSAQRAVGQESAPGPFGRTNLGQSAGSGPAMYSQQARSRPASPNAIASRGIQRAPSPSAAMMRPPSQASGEMAPAQAQYGQAFPGERRQSIAPPSLGQQSRSRPSSPAPSNAGLQSPPPVSIGPAGYAGIGIYGRVSPGPGQRYGPPPQQGMRSPSPGPVTYPNQSQFGLPQSQQGYGLQGQQRPFSAYVPPSPQQMPASVRHRATNLYGGTGDNSIGLVSGTVQSPPSQQHIGRPSTPLGIALDASGHVTQDQMAEKYTAQYQRLPKGGSHPQEQPQLQAQPAQHGYSALHNQQAYQSAPSPGPQYIPPQASVPPNQQSAGYRRGETIYRQGQQQQQNRLSSQPPAGSPGPGPGPGPGGMTTSPSAPSPMTSSYAQPTMYPNGPGQRGSAYANGAGYSQHGPDQHQQQQPPQSPMGYGQQQMSQGTQRPLSQNANRSQSMGQGFGGGGGGGYPQQVYQQAQPPAAQLHHQQSNSYLGAGPPQQQPPPPSSHGYGGSSPGAMYEQQNGNDLPARSPSSGPPADQYTESGRPILFSVRAIYKYDAQSPEEFSFQKDDVICVVDTAEDGWWTGELLDPDRARRSGGNVFPSNFVTLLE